MYTQTITKIYVDKDATTRTDTVVAVLYKNEVAPTQLEEANIILKNMDIDYVQKNLSQYFATEYHFVITNNGVETLVMSFFSLFILLAALLPEQRKFFIQQLVLISNWNEKGTFDFDSANRILNHIKNVKKGN